MKEPSWEHWPDLQPPALFPISPPDASVSFVAHRSLHLKGLNSHDYTP
jgi:hypothetical protein